MINKQNASKRCALNRAFNDGGEKLCIEGAMIIHFFFYLDVYKKIVILVFVTYFCFLCINCVWTLHTICLKMLAWMEKTNQPKFNVHEFECCGRSEWLGITLLKIRLVLSHVPWHSRRARITYSIENKFDAGHSRAIANDLRFQHLITNYEFGKNYVSKHLVYIFFSFVQSIEKNELLLHVFGVSHSISRLQWQSIAYIIFIVINIAFINCEWTKQMLHSM